MRKTAISLLCAASVMAVVGVKASLNSSAGVGLDTSLPQEQPTPPTVTLNASPDRAPHALDGARLQAVKTLAQAAKRSSITSVDQLAGEYVQTYSALNSYSYDGGCGVTISTGDNNSVTITNFYTAQTTPITLTGTADLEQMTITFPAQYIYNNSTYGDIWAATCSSTGKPDYDTPMTATINDDGTIDMTSWWGAYVKEGDSADSYFQLSYNTKFEPANGRMTYVNSSGSTVDFGIVATQTSPNTVDIKNFANYGCTVELILNRDLTTTIEQQVARHSSVGDWFTIANPALDSSTNQLSYTASITTNVANDNRNISWGEWSLLSTSYYMGTLSSGSIALNFDLSYPSLSVTDFEGEGTEASPYLIKSVDELVLLAEKVNSDDSYIWPTPTSSSRYTRSYLGKYFRVENDIDLQGRRFTPIGYKLSQVFAGTFDGNGKKISGLDVNTGSTGYAGLFGVTDTVSVVKNLTLEAPKVVTEGNFCGGMVGYSRGTIQGCYVNSPYIYSEGITAAGLVGIGTIVDDCHVTGANIYAYNGYGGGVAGQINESITNSSAEETTIVTDSDSGNAPFGGVVGSLYKSSAADCYFTGTVDGFSNSIAETIGGVAGVTYMGTIERCFATGVLRGYSSDAVQGGLVGHIYDAQISNSYFTGYIYDAASRYTGGLVGRLATVSGSDVIKNCYSAAEIIAETYQYDTSSEYRETFGTIESGTFLLSPGCYFDKKLTFFNSTRYVSTTAELTSASGPANYDSSVWVFSEGNYPRLKSSAETQAAALSASAISFGDNTSRYKITHDLELKPLGDTKYLLLNNGVLSTQGHYSSIVDNNQLKISDKAGRDTLYIVNGGMQVPYDLYISPSYWDGEGTEASPYLIKTKDDLHHLADATTNYGMLYPEAYFKFANDIDFEGDKSFIGICADPNDANVTFGGTIDGDGHTIHNFPYDCVIWTTRPEDADNGVGTPDNITSKPYKGFIGRLGTTGVIKNLSFAADCSFECWAYTGAFVGQNYGLVENCKNYANVNGYSCVIGGIVGQNMKDGIIRNCYNEGDITCGYIQVGGIAGYNNGYIEQCMNAGNVTDKWNSNFKKGTDTNYNFAGGIAGAANGGVFKNVVNLGTVTAKSHLAGGISGSLPVVTASMAKNGSGYNDIYSALNYGNVVCSDVTLIGAIAGGGSNTGGDTSDGGLSNIYYDAQILTHGAVANGDKRGMNQSTTATLISGSAIEGLDTSIWQYDAGSYPVLKQFANEDKAQRLRNIVVNIPEGSTIDDLRVDATLSQADGLIWTLAQGKYFSIEGNTLKAPAVVTDITYDTLYATYGNVVKTFYLTAIAQLPLSGEGTEESPYLIETPADWNALAYYTQAVAEPLEGKFIKIVNDLDFTDIDFSPLYIDGVTQFQGTLDGNNKTLRGINYTTTGTFQAAIGVIGENATVKNLSIDGQFTSAYAYSAAFVGKVYGKLDNCVNYASITSTKTYTTGLIAGVYTGAVVTNCYNRGNVTASANYVAGVLASSSMVDAYFENCGNEGTITIPSGNSAGYIAGFAACSYPATFINCYNTGQIVIDTPANHQYVAGFLAYANSSVKTSTFILKGCYNTADVTGKASVAGIVAWTQKTAGNVIYQMEDCYNTGNVASVSTSAVSSNPTGGIACFYNPGSTYKNCYNTGNVSTIKNLAIGGLFGTYDVTPSATLPIEITGCYNTGNISAGGNTGGGLVGTFGAYTTMEDCYNTGDVSGGYKIGGLCGEVMGATSAVHNCYNTGNVTSSLNRVGGLFGVASASAADIQGCWNSGNVATTSEKQGTTTASSGFAIGGVAGASASTFVNCMNFGQVKGVSQVGGLVGQPSKIYTKFKNCYNAGKIIAPTDTCGNIVGVNTANAKIWTESNTVENTYYLTDGNEGISLDAIGEAVTTAQLAKLNMGSDWTSTDDYSFPIQSVYANCDAALLHSAKVVGQDDETSEKLTKPFFVGNPEGIVWTAEPTGLLNFNGNNVDIASAYTGKVILTATLGDWSKQEEITLEIASGVESIYSDKDIAQTLYFTPAGIQVATPTDHDGAIYIVVVKYTDGTSKAYKLINK
jgi:hypothetical protein